MKKQIVFLLLVALCIGLAGCKPSQPEVTQPPAVNDPVETTQQQTEPVSFCEFRDLTWTRESETCVETLRFLTDGSCSYSCACGDPVNDADLCEGYRYEEQSKTIFLEFEETTEQTVTQITVKSCDGKTLVLDFAGQERIFTPKA